MSWSTAWMFPDAELVLIGALRSALAARPEPYAANVFVSNKVPASRRDRMVIVRRDGGSVSGHRDQARLGVRVWALDETEAANLARLVQALLSTFPGSHGVLKVVHHAGPMGVTEDSPHRVRYLSSEVHLRGVPL